MRSMKLIADRLPPEIAKQLHPDRRRNEEGYWKERERLLAQFDGQWIGFADGEVIASGRSPVEVFHASETTRRNAFFICVGREEVPDRIRRTSFNYDREYDGEPLPRLTVGFRNPQAPSTHELDRVIADTGADASVLPWDDCARLQLNPSHGVQRLMTGISGSEHATLAFDVWAVVDGRELPCRLQADFHGNERILGRDVLNRLDVLFRGPVGELVINP
jgi:hypothetical protein